MLLALGAGSLASVASGSPTDAPPCGRSPTRHGFVAFDRGDYAKLDSLFATKPDFQWYSSPPPGRRLGRAAGDRDTLIPYIRRRHARHDRLCLLTFHFTGRARHWSNFWFELRRALLPGRPLVHDPWQGRRGLRRPSSSKVHRHQPQRPDAGPVGFRVLVSAA